MSTFDMPVFCSECGESFSNDIALALHMQEEHEEDSDD